MSSSTPMQRLAERVARLGAPLCLGIDPHPDQLPEDAAGGIAGIEAFARGVLEAAADQAAAVKINVAFFEAFGAAGWAALERLRRDVPADHVLILDAKRGDIGSTAERYAEALLGHLRADGVTVSPYVGREAVDAFVTRGASIVYVLARTSNADAGELQDVHLEGGLRLHERVARWVSETWTEPRVGLVVGATAPAELMALRALVPDPPFLVPGVGAQGGDASAAAAACHGARGPGLVNVSRGIALASRGPDWREAAARAARDWRDRLAGAGATLGA